MVWTSAPRTACDNRDADGMMVHGSTASVLLSGDLLTVGSSGLPAPAVRGLGQSGHAADAARTRH